jgi:homoserine dehydrogenase
MSLPSALLPSTEPLRVGLIGFGCVGQGLYNLLERLPAPGFTVARIAVRNPQKARSLPPERFEFRADALIEDDSLDLLVEVIDDPVEAFRFVGLALRRGRRVVTANKAMVARHLPALLRQQADYGGTLLYEAAVCGSIPIIRTLDTYFATEPLTAVSGIFNGSSNYVLTQMRARGTAYAEALAEAQARGFAETDPTLDMAAFDPRAKAVILAAHAFGLIPNPADVLALGIESIAPIDLKQAALAGHKIKIVARLLTLPDGGISVLVAPQRVAPDSPLFAVEDEFNAVLVEGTFAGPHALRGRGAGSFPTASAVLADLNALRAGFRYAYAKLDPHQALATDLALEVVVRSYARQRPPTVEFLGEPYAEIVEGYRFQTGYVAYTTLHRLCDDLRADGVFVVGTGAIQLLPDDETDPQLSGARAAVRFQ